MFCNGGAWSREWFEESFPGGSGQRLAPQKPPKTFEKRRNLGIEEKKKENKKIEESTNLNRILSDVRQTKQYYGGGQDAQR